MKIGLKQKFWIYSIACIVVLPAVLSLLALLFYLGLPAESRQVCREIMPRNLIILVGAGMFAFMCLMILANEVFHAFILPLERLREELRLFPVVGPSHRVVLKKGGKETRDLADGVNKAVELISALQQKPPETHASGRDKKTAEERDFLGRLVSEIPGGVAAANEGGRIFLYTKAASDLVEMMHNASLRPEKGPPMGLDRCIFSVLAEQIGLQETAAGRWDYLLPDSGDRRPPVEVSFEWRGIHGRFLKTGADNNFPHYYLVFLQSKALQTTGKMPGQGAAGIKKRPPGFPHYDLDLWKKKSPDPTGDIRERPLAELTYTVFDLETTGLDPAGGDEILSIGAVRVVNGRILFEETFYQMVYPAGGIPDRSTKIHGIAGSMLSGQPGIESVMPDFLRYIEDSVLVCHCAEVDCRFLGTYARGAGIRIENPVLDTFALSCLVQPSRTDHSLEKIAGRLGTKVYDRHIAYGDAWTTAEILIKLIALLADSGIHTLGQVPAQRVDSFAAVR